MKISANFNDICSSNDHFVWKSEGLIRKVGIDNFAVCEVPQSYDQSIVSQYKGNIFIDANKKTILWLKSRSSYKVEVEGKIITAWLCNIISLQKFVTLTGISETDQSESELEFKEVPIINARCEKSMKSLDKINRKFIQNAEYTSNQIVAIKAVAGSGKTTTLLNLAKRDPSKKILYLAFNKSLIDEIRSKIKFQNIKNLIPKTFDALMREVYIHIKGEEPAITELTPQYLSTTFPWFNGKAFKLKKYYCKQFANFCSNINFADIDKYCKANINGKNTFLQDLWKLTLTNQFQTFDSIRKLVILNHWAKEYIDTKYNMIFIDEAQDFDRVMLDILIEDTSIPKIFVGDPLQAIYEWRGCINAFDYLPKNTLIVEFYSTFRVGEPACSQIARKFSNCWMMSKNPNETLLEENGGIIGPDEKYIYLFRSWKGLLLKAKELKNIWIYGFDKQIVTMRKLHEVLKFAKLSDDEKGEFSDDLPMFLMQLSSDELNEMLVNIQENLVDFDDEECMCKMYTIHSYKGMENDIVRIANDIDIAKELNLYYVALTRGIKRIVLDSHEKAEMMGLPRAINTNTPMAQPLISSFGFQKLDDEDETGDKEIDFHMESRLKTLRGSLAAEAAIPPYCVFPNSTLNAIVKQKPRTQYDLLQIPGIGKNKLEKYGDNILEIVINAV